MTPQGRYCIFPGSRVLTSQPAHVAREPKVKTHDEMLEDLQRAAAVEILQRIIQHEEAPEGIEFFDLLWINDRSPDVIATPVESLIDYLRDEGSIPPYIELEVDEIHAGPLHGYVTLATPLGSIKHHWRVGWNRKGRKLVLWFADGLPRRRQ